MSGTDGYRYPGPNEFEDTPADHLLFSGRNDEINAITQQIVSSRLLVLYGSSGLGKSSLLKAGVYPKLRENNFCPVRVRITDKLSVLQLLAQSCAETGREADLDYTPGVGSTPWEFFKTAMFWRGETLLYPVLVFDQFEELFTTVAPSWKTDFANEIGPLASGNLPTSVRQRLEQGEKGLTDLPPQVKLIFSLREEFYGSLEELSSDFPALFQDRFRLLPMDRSRAELAIRLPALKESEAGITFNTPPFTYSDETLKTMLGFLAGRHGTIEPFQLQLLCQHVERVIVPGKLRVGGSLGIEITPSDLGGERVMSDLVRRFYTDSLAQLPIGQGRRARELCDTGLLSSDGHRLMLEKNEILRNYRISETTLRHLIDRRILREEPRLDSLFYEIGHDTIAQSILKTRRLRLPRKYRVPAAVVAALVLIFTSYVIFANFRLRSERDREKTATVNALQAQGKAEDARNKAEKLASYLIGEDLMGAIKPMGRMEVLEGVEKQIDEYLDSLKSSQTEKSSDLAIQIGGLAHLNRGDLAYMREEVTQEEIEYQQARGAFEQLVQRNARNPEWLHNLADAEAKLADVSSDRLQVQQSLDLYRQALSHIQTALPEVPPGKDDKLRDKLLRDEADTRQNIGADLYVQRHLDEAVTQLRQSVSLATPKGPEQSTQWMYILEDGLQGEGLIFEVQGKDQEAEKAYNSALEIAERAAHKNPFDPEAHRRLGAAENRLANFNIYRRKPEQILPQYESLNHIMQEDTGWEPNNQRWKRDLAYSYLLIGQAYSYLEKRDIAEKSVQNANARFTQLQKIDKSNASLRNDLSDSYTYWGDYAVGTDPKQATLYYKDALTLLADLRKIDPTNKELIASSAVALIKEARALISSRQYDQALAACDQASQVLSAYEPIDPSDAEYWEISSELHKQMSEALRGKGQTQEADREYQAALKDIDTAIQRAPSSPRYWNDRFLTKYDYTIEGESSTEKVSDRQLKTYQDALLDSQKAVELDPICSYYHANFAVVQQKIGDISEDRGQMNDALARYASAEQSFKKAIELAGQLETQRDLNDLCNLLAKRIAPLRARQNDTKGVIQAYKQALQIRKDALAAEPKNPTRLDQLAVLQTDVGDALSDEKQQEAANGYYSDAERSYRMLIASVDKSTANSYRDALYLVLRKHIAPRRAKQGDIKGSLQAYERAIQVKKDQLAAESNNLAYRADLAKAYQDIGDDLLDQNQLTDAGNYYKEAEGLRREVIKLKPDAVAWDELGGLYYNSLASLSDKQSNLSAEIDYYRQAIDAEKQASALDPTNAIYHSNMGYAYQAIGNLETADQTTARRDYDAALQAAIKAGELNPKEKKYSEERASIENSLRQLAP